MHNGHPTNKLEIIVIGGTFSAYPEDYKIEFVTKIYEACNGSTWEEAGIRSTVPGETDKWRLLETAQEKNETAARRIVALSVETRPDWVTEKEVVLMRRLGVTKVQLGVQAIDDEIAKKTKRGHGAKEVAQATRLLRDAGMKICYHIMPNLPGSSPEKDIEMSRLIYMDPRFMPDYVKIYPCMVIPGTELFRMWQRGEHRTYSDEELKYVLKEVNAMTPRWVRIDRLVRDISRKWVAAGTVMTNFRQVVEKELKEEGRPCRCIRCREVGSDEFQITNYKLQTVEYRTEGGREIFLSAENEQFLYALLRLRLPDEKERLLFPELKGAAIVREVHSYGQVAALSTRSKGKAQHQGLGRLLMEKSEDIARENGYKKLAVISAIGTREYYLKLGYQLEGLYMTKTL
jgi:elongator complex protein 3